MFLWDKGFFEVYFVCVRRIKGCGDSLNLVMFGLEDLLRERIGGFRII